jgi:sugar transferase (PEP-CTERM/EpsH1 system associated)
MHTLLEPDAPVRVLHLVPQFRLGGMEQGVVKVTNGLPADRISSTICSFDGPVDGIVESLDPRVSVTVLGRRAGNDPMLVLRLAQLLRRERPDVVHSHGWGTLCEGYAASCLAGVRRFMHSEHGTMELRPRNLRVQRAVWSRADRVVAVSSMLADRMARVTGFPRDRVQVIVNGADLARFGSVDRVSARATLNLPSDAFVIGTVGRLVPVKDQETLLGAVARLRSAGSACLALIAGDGPLHDALRARAAALGVESAIRFLGRRGDVERILASLDVFVLTSLSEGMPNSILEAMAAGLPVVSTAVGGVFEVVDDGVTGLLAPVGDVDGIAGALGTLARDGALRSRMGAQGSARARSHFSLGRMLEQYERMYLELAMPASSVMRMEASQSACVESLVE